MDEWMRYARWHRAHLSAEDLAGIFDAATEVVQRDVAAGSVHFPAPDTSAFDGRPQWSERDVFVTIRHRYPHLAHRIPRLFPRSETLASAQFVSARAVDLGDGACGFVDGQYAIHTWQPCDGGAAVAIAYRADNTPRPHNHRERELAAALLDYLGVSAVIVPTAHQAILYTDEPDSGGQPHVEVADNSSSTLTNWAWFDVVGLLRVDLPWWPGGLADMDAMLAWSPGAQRHVVHAQADGAAAAWILKTAAGGATSESAIGALDRLATWADYKLCQDWGLEPEGSVRWQDLRERPGLTRAALPAIPAQHCEPTVPDLQEALHHRVEDQVAAFWAIRTGQIIDLWSPLIAPDVVVINRDACSKLAHQFCNRLEPVVPERRSELGFARVAAFMSGRDVAPRQWWRDPHNPDMWIISDVHGTMYASIGYWVPAHGKLTELTVGHALDPRWGEQVVFFRDSESVSWPMPTTAQGYYVCGGEVGGSNDLLPSSVLTLLDDAAADTRKVRRDDIAGTGLERYFATTPAPIHVSGRDLSAMRG